ncbi:hypothetical protein AB0M47_07025 [Hamadaea sp. NPDC051192]|uniref:hypothetical protein n=1 Tax=Hamadaea sp. NPDC051192 TaxID=3154940 RepID=UPI00343767EF
MAGAAPVIPDRAGEIALGDTSEQRATAAETETSRSASRTTSAPAPTPTATPTAPVSPATTTSSAAPTARVPATPSGGSGGPRTDRTNLSYSNGGITSSYHLYAAGLNWTKPVGLLVYADGSGEYGLKNPSSTYLLAGTNGMIAVAKRQNMVLLTPLAPGTGCPDGDGTCWYETSSGYTPTQKTAWSHNLVEYVKSRYNIDTARVALGGYSSGAQWLTEYFAPAYGVRTMTDGVGVAISYGGRCIATPTFTAAYKAAVPFVWDVGDQDSAWTSSYGVKAGESWYRANGFTTQLHLVPGLDHDRSGQFGAILEREIREHLGG